MGWVGILAAAGPVLSVLLAFLVGYLTRRDEAKKRLAVEQSLVRLREDVDQRLLVLRTDVDRSLKAVEARVHVARDIRRKILERRIDDVRDYRTKLIMALNEVHLFGQYAWITGPLEKTNGRFSEGALERIERCLCAIAAVPAAGPFVPPELTAQSSVLLGEMQACFREVVQWSQMTDPDERKMACAATESQREAIGQKSRTLFDEWITRLLEEHESALAEFEVSPSAPPSPPAMPPASQSRLLPVGTTAAGSLATESAGGGPASTAKATNRRSTRS